MERDIAYYMRRHAEERRAGMTAASEVARNCHFELAAAYEAKLKELAATKRRSALHIVSAA